jgi:hypothetical protein
MVSVVFGMTIRVVLPWMQLVQSFGVSGSSLLLLISIPLTIPSHSSLLWTPCWCGRVIDAK